ncbi:MAG: double zinc ribbon domain-containing protein [Patescibacteria group bacterium]
MNTESFINILFPSRCINCEKQTEGRSVICAECFGNIDLNKTLFCGQCRARLPEGKKVCHKSAPYLLGAAANYENGAVKNMIHGLKFRFLKKSGEALGKLLVHYVDSVAKLQEFDIDKKDGAVVIPIPLSKKRERVRGFNQSEIIARVFADRYEFDLALDCLVRTRDTVPQSETGNIAERLRNVRECFSVINEKPLIDKKMVVLIDDVTTSGATILAAAKELKRVGVKHILALVIAKA